MIKSWFMLTYFWILYWLRCQRWLIAVVLLLGLIATPNFYYAGLGLKDALRTGAAFSGMIFLMGLSLKWVLNGFKSEDIDGCRRSSNEHTDK